MLSCRCVMYITCLSWCQSRSANINLLACSQCVLVYFSTRMQLAAHLLTRVWWAVAVEMVEAETGDLPVKHCTVPRNQYGQLCVDSIKEYLAGSGQTLVSIGNGYPACKDGWTLNSYSAIPIQLHVAPKPGRRSIAKCKSRCILGVDQSLSG